MEISWTLFKNFIQRYSTPIYWIELENLYILTAQAGPLIIKCSLSKTPADPSDLQEFEENYKNIIN